MRTFYLDSLNRTANFKFEFNKEISDSIKNASYSSRWNPELGIPIPTLGIESSTFQFQLWEWGIELTAKITPYV